MISTQFNKLHTREILSYTRVLYIKVRTNNNLHKIYTKRNANWKSSHLKVGKANGKTVQSLGEGAKDEAL